MAIISNVVIDNGSGKYFYQSDQQPVTNATNLAQKLSYAVINGISGTTQTSRWTYLLGSATKANYVRWTYLGAMTYLQVNVSSGVSWSNSYTTLGTITSTYAPKAGYTLIPCYPFNLQVIVESNGSVRIRNYANGTLSYGYGSGCWSWGNTISG